MIKFSNQVPSIYPNASRDFQYLGWLIDVVLNSVKHNVDDIYDLPNNQADIKLTELLALTLGFKVKRNYDQKQLSALVAALPRILKYKGTKTAVDMAGNALIAASGVLGDYNSEVNNCELTVTFPVGLIDISLFTDLLDYILPAGMTCHIVRETKWVRPYATELDYNDILQAEWVPDISFDNESKTISGLASIFEAKHGEDASFSNFTTIAEGENTLTKINTGLLDSNIIPILGTPLVNYASPEEPSTNINSQDNFEATDTAIVDKTSDGITVTIGGN